jgi:hypothetical protein
MLPSAVVERRRQSDGGNMKANVRHYFDCAVF